MRTAAAAAGDVASAAFIALPSANSSEGERTRSLVALRTTSVPRVGLGPSGISPRFLAQEKIPPRRPAEHCFDRDTSAPIVNGTLKTYRQALAQYHLSPESKFVNGEPFDIGPTQRRHVKAIAIHHIGKEANRWEEQFHLGFNEDDQIDYGLSPQDFQTFLIGLRAKIIKLGLRKIAKRFGTSRRTVTRFVKYQTSRKATINKLSESLNP
jgi:hypothetical protein